MDIMQPTAAELEQLRAQNAFRHPRSARIPVLGDHGARISLTIVIGNPTGACRLPAGSRPPSPVWRTIVDGILAGRLETGGISDLIAADCLLWPDAATFNAWRDRWPALPSDVALAALKKVGGAMRVIVEPSVIDAPSEPVAAALAAHPRAVWRKLEPTGARYDAVIDTPDSVKYDAVRDAFDTPGADSIELSRSFAEAQLVACFNAATKEPVRPSEIFDRHPGLAVLVAVHAQRLCGAYGEVQLGEW